MHATPEVGIVAERYDRFAREEAPTRSPLYAAWAAGVASDARLQQLIATLPATRRQPPLVFAITRMLGAPESDVASWTRWVLAHREELVREVANRGLQTNEPLRCAALLPALSAIAGPIALVELGASAGLCLHLERYSYRYGAGPTLDPPGGASAVVLWSQLTGAPPLRLPEIVWRTGIDLAPLDAADPADARFLRALVWPGETGRLERIDAALDIARAHPVPLVRADASAPGVLRAAVATAPGEATLVVTTPGLLPHLDRAGRTRLLAEITALRSIRPDLRWITLDPPGLAVSGGADADTGVPGFVLAIDGAPVGRADPLGGWVEWHTGDV